MTRVQRSEVKSRLGADRVRTAIPVSAQGPRFLPPPQQGPLLMRRRLVAEACKPVVLIQAPAGYGKTVLLAQVFAAARGRRAWVSLSPASATFERLRDDMASALAAVCAFVPSAAAAPAAEGARLAESLCLGEQPMLLAIDDYHLASNASADAFMRAFLAGLHAPCRVALATRAHASIGAAALAAKHALCRLGPGELAFTETETGEVLGDDLDRDEAALTAAWRASDGWPAAISLARQLIAEGLAPAMAIGGAAGPVGAFLREETFDPLDEDLKRFLIETAPLVSLDAEAANAIRVAGDSALCLNRLEQSGALVFAERSGWRRHNLLDQFLAPRFAALPEAERLARLNRAWRLQARRGETAHAFACVRAAGADHAALAALDRAGVSAWNVGALAAAQSHLMDLEDEAFAEAPGLAALVAAAAFDAGAPAARVQAAVERAQAQVEALESVDPPAALLWRALETAFRGQALERGERELLGGPEGARSLALHARAAHALIEGAHEDALDSALRCVRGARIEGDGDLELALATLAFAAFSAGRLEVAWRALNEPAADDRPQASHAPPARYAAARAAIGALVAFERGDAAPALDSSAGERADAPRLLALSAPLAWEDALFEARRAFEDAGFDQARAVLQRARARAKKQAWTRAVDLFDAEELTLAVCAGERGAAGAAARALERHFGRGGRAPPWVALALARQRLACGAPEGARALLGPLVRPGAVSRRTLARALVLEAKASLKMGASDEANAALARFFGECGAEAGARAFFEDGAELFELACALAGRLAPSDAGARALETAASLALARPRFQGEGALAPPSAQERAMFDALRTTGSRVEAARSLEISENTLKFYLKRAFQKWRVNDWRLAAAVAARLAGQASPDARVV